MYKLTIIILAIYVMGAYSAQLETMFQTRTDPYATCASEYAWGDSFDLDTNLIHDSVTGHTDYTIKPVNSHMEEVICYAHAMIENCDPLESGSWSETTSNGLYTSGHQEGAVDYLGTTTTEEWTLNYYDDFDYGCVIYEEWYLDYMTMEEIWESAESCWDVAGLCHQTLSSGYTPDDPGLDDDFYFFFNSATNKYNLGGGKCEWEGDSSTLDAQIESDGEINLLTGDGFADGYSLDYLTFETIDMDVLIEDFDISDNS